VPRHASLPVLAALLVLAAGPGLASPLATAEWGVVTVKNGVLTLDVAAAPLDVVLRAIAAQAGFELRLRGDLSAPITARLAPRPLAAGLVRLLSGHSTSVTYVRGSDGRDAIERLVVVAASPSSRLQAHRGIRTGEIRRLTRLPGPRAASGLAALLRGDADPAVRAAAAAALGRVGGRVAAAALITALADVAPTVRARAAHALAESSPADARRLLPGRLRTDPDAGVRRGLAVLLGRGTPTPEALAALDAAREDPSAAVRHAATSALAGWAR
jgi:hypothetical protein